tara:strand:- start:950 stop:1744 length:795 start_codon:yes stop_codon:yes gene_type:complete
MKISIYSTAFNILDKAFDHKDALDNWFCYADEVCIAVNKSVDDTESEIRRHGLDKGYNLKVIPVDIPYDDPFCYGKTENYALQGCSGDLLIQQNLDERLGGDKAIIKSLGQQLLENERYASLFVPVINLYGDYNHFIDFGAKWYIHKRGLKRGPVNFAIKEDGRPDYNKTSTDELIDHNGNLLETFPLCDIQNTEATLKYCQSGSPFVYHLGYVDLKERLKVNKFWHNFWVEATGGDPNAHDVSEEDLNKKERQKHNLTLWKKL